MKNTSLIVNVVLGIAVAVLYYLHFATNTPSTGSDPVPVDHSAEKTADEVKVTKAQGEAIIVYVNIDTLFEKYHFYKDVSTLVEQNLMAMESNFKMRVQKYQQELNEYMEKAQAGLIPKETAEGIEQKLMKQKASIENDEKLIGTRQENEGKRLEKVQRKLYEFFKAFTAKNNYSCVLTYTAKGEGALGINDDLDVTDEVVKTLNEEYEKMKKEPGFKL